MCVILPKYNLPFLLGLFLELNGRPSSGRLSWPTAGPCLWLIYIVLLLAHLVNLWFKCQVVKKVIFAPGKHVKRRS